MTASGNIRRIAWSRSWDCCSALPWRFMQASTATVMSTASLIALSGPLHALGALHLLRELLHAPGKLFRVAEEAAEGVF